MYRRTYGREIKNKEVDFTPQGDELNLDTFTKTIIVLAIVGIIIGLWTLKVNGWA